MNAKRKPFMNRVKKKLVVILSVVLISNSFPTREAEASWFSDLCGAIFTLVTAPIWVFCPDSPTFRKNNPFRKKEWEEAGYIYNPSEDEEEKKKFVPIVTHNILKSSKKR
jgi:hypothetical protein